MLALVFSFTIESDELKHEAFGQLEKVTQRDFMWLTNEMSIVVFAAGKMLKGNTRLNNSLYCRTCLMSTTSDPEKPEKINHPAIASVLSNII